MMVDLRKPHHDERLAPCPICGGEPWVDSKSGTIYCDCGLRHHINGECHPEWHRMDWTAEEWNRLANVRAENYRLEKRLAQYELFCEVVGDPAHEFASLRRELHRIEREYIRLRKLVHAMLQYIDPASHQDTCGIECPAHSMCKGKSMCAFPDWAVKEASKLGIEVDDDHS